MELWPAIDVRQGRCVRLLRGDFGAETVYGDPLQVASDYSARGATRLHVVDLDGARDGSQVHADLIVAIARETGARVQAGGGIRDERSAAGLLHRGVSRVVLGTASVEDPQLLRRLTKRWPRRIVVGLDYHRPAGDQGRPGGTADARGPDEAADRVLALRGWEKRTNMPLVEAARALAELDLAAVVATDISRDGTGSGTDLAGLTALLDATGHDIVASGGVGSGGDLRALRELSVGAKVLAGAIVGRALLSGAVSIESALEICEEDVR